jgi:NADPH:quinone reductase-like Zn-dependent oxidoreductase
MRALVSHPDSHSGLGLADIAAPQPGPHENLIEVSHSSLNWGELMGARLAEPGLALGWDAAGVVVQSAADGSGPAVGSRVTSFGGAGGWAQHRAVPSSELAVVPDDVSAADAAALPAAGVSALRALHLSGPLLGKRVLVTGASGGVGRLAVQLAVLGGAEVVAASGRTAGLAELGAAQVVSRLDDVGPLDVVIDNVGGPQLAAAWDLVRPGGVIQCVGWTSGEPAVFEPYSLVGPAKSITAFKAGTDFGEDLAVLLELVASGRLTVELGWQGSWERIDEAAAALVGRHVSGKAVLAIS